ncbi:MAG: type II toxin-antitoxin system HicB family antitoxin [Desulfarculales bacterium]|jgi:predicted RNase H-like HicB family nuclease|nr:type II toxin-antitoxin system HicB family antitoxin [Desulfarculales bacterium]
MYYPATLDPHEDGSGRYDVTFADLPGCVSQGQNLEQALKMAQEALTLHVFSMLRDGDPLPAPSTLEEAKAKSEGMAAEGGYTLAEGTLYQYVLAAEPAAKEDKPVSVTVSLRPAILARVDAAAKTYGFTRSSLLAVAAQHYIKNLDD